MKNFLKYFVLTLLFFLTSVSFSYAYTVHRYTAFSHDASQFDGYWNPSNIAVLKGIPGTLDVVFLHGVPQVPYRGYIYYLGYWKTANVTLVAADSVMLDAKNVTFPVTGNDRLAAYIEPINGGEAFYATTEALVYEKESIQTFSNWTTAAQWTIAPNTYTSPLITSPSGKTIAGLEFKVDIFSTININPICINDPDNIYECGYFKFSDSTLWLGAGNNKSGKVGYVLRTGSEKPSVYIYVSPSDYDGCNGVCGAEILVGSNNNITLYTRNPAKPAIASPKPPESYCYIKNKIRYCCYYQGLIRVCKSITVPSPKLE